jgi:hypothetical protein
MVTGKTATTQNYPAKGWLNLNRKRGSSYDGLLILVWV